MYRILTWTERTMQYLNPLDIKIKPVDRSVDPAKPLSRAGRAVAFAQSAFGGNYAPPSEADWRDRSPAEIAVIRATMWGGAK